SLNTTLSDDVLITNWLPRDVDGIPNGAVAPQNFEIDMRSTTQYGSPFAVNDLRQNGYTTGRITGLDISSDGVVFARYSNGQSQVIAQVALATFRNPEGLSAVGETTWVETFESGDPIIGAANTGPLGSIKSSSVEESNVDLSAQLVNLIIAQRNFQANAKTIETADTLTQTIINLR
ncbi:MAG: flagellar hook-basal body complex protein, partial [Gammaproteobacteria bacterium]|nr:flagellar hook-basal body complex protein [Gammaproteobacteria bacterium]